MHARTILLAGFALVALFLFASPTPAQAQSFCDYCWAAGNCCNPFTVTCVRCGDESPTDTLKQLEESIFGPATTDRDAAEHRSTMAQAFCDECFGAGNACNPKRFLCVATATTPNENDRSPKPGAPSRRER